MPEFAEWDNFYVIMGSAAGALIGLQFVVMTLIANMPASRGSEQAGRAFATPSVVHFVVVLLLSGTVAVPWHEITPAALVWGVVGLGGIAYILVSARRMRAQTVYRPVFEDWLFHVLLPIAAYALLGASAFVAFNQIHTALFLVGGAALLLLFVGIHNAWDAVTYHVFVRRQ